MNKDFQTECSINASQKTKDTIQKQQLVNCRICFQQMELNQVPNICKCQQQSSAIHQKCLSQWIKSAVMQEEGLFSRFIRCNVCQSKIYLTTKTTYKCIPLRKIDFCHKELCCTLMMGLVMLIGIAMIGMSLMLLQSGRNDNLVNILSYSGIVIGSAITILDVLCFVYLMMISKQVTVESIKGVKGKVIEYKSKPETPEKPQSSNDSYSKFCIKLTSEQMLEDITDY